MNILNRFEELKNNTEFLAMLVAEHEYSEDRTALAFLLDDDFNFGLAKFDNFCEKFCLSEKSGLLLIDALADTLENGRKSIDENEIFQY